MLSIYGLTRGNNHYLCYFQVIRAVNETFSFEDNSQEMEESQESFIKFFEEKLRYDIFHGST